MAYEHPDLSAAELGQRAQAFFLDNLQKVVAGYFDGTPFPGWLGGYPVGSDVIGDLLYCLGYAHDIGAKDIAGQPIPDRIRDLLRRIDGPRTDTFYSYRTAETLLRFGDFAHNPLLADFTDAERVNIAEACDSTGIWRREEDDLVGKPNNYWGVLARCEIARQQLGLIETSEALTRSIQQIGRLLARNPTGFFDDGKHGEGRYDIYSFDVHLFAEPFWDRLDPAMLERNLVTHARLFEDFGHENGASVAWGRSTGVLSVLLTIEYGAMLLQRELAQDVPLVLHRTANALDRLRDWFDLETGLMTAHHYRSPYGYRGPHRYLQITLDGLGKVAYAAKHLSGLAITGPAISRREAFPTVDSWTPFENDRPLGVWSYRSDQLAFQLPVVCTFNTDYSPTPMAPGLFEVPVDETITCGLPIVRVEGADYHVLHRPVSVEKIPGGLILRYDALHRHEHPYSDAPEHIPTRVELRWQVEGDQLRQEISLATDGVPEAITWRIPEAQRKLDLAVEGTASQTVIPIAGMKPFRSFWGEFPRLHEVHVEPAREVSFSVTVHPRLRILAIPGEHDYVQGLLRPLEDRFTIDWQHQHLDFSTFPVREIARRCDVLYVGWPEHLFAGTWLDWQKFRPSLAEWLNELARSRVRVIWTMHNRLPHRADDERGAELYRLWAPVADGVLHHSEVGQARMRAELPYRTDALHAVIPHGVFEMPEALATTRADAEQALGLSPKPLRLGLLGLFQAGKQIEKILTAFARTEREDLSLLVTAVRPETDVPEDARITVIPRPANRLFTREEIGQQLAACDAIIAIPRGEAYLTTGQVADSIGARKPLLCNDWAFFREIMGEAAVPVDDQSEETLADSFTRLTHEQLEQAAIRLRPLEQRYSWRASAEIWADVCRKVGALTSGR